MQKRAQFADNVSQFDKNKLNKTRIPLKLCCQADSIVKMANKIAGNFLLLNKIKLGWIYIGNANPEHGFLFQIEIIIYNIYYSIFNSSRSSSCAL